MAGIRNRGHVLAAVSGQQQSQPTIISCSSITTPWRNDHRNLAESTPKTHTLADQALSPLSTRLQKTPNINKLKLISGKTMSHCMEFLNSCFTFRPSRCRARRGAYAWEQTYRYTSSPNNTCYGSSDSRPRPTPVQYADI